MKTVRRPYFSQFYRGDLRGQIVRFLASYEPAGPEAPALRAAVVPHAGWRFSGGTAARTLKTLADRSSPDCMVLLGAVHRAHLKTVALWPEGEWQTPLGPVAVDSALAADILLHLGGLVVEDPSAHEEEHSLEVQLPFVLDLFPEVPIVPMLVPPIPSAVRLGRSLGALLKDRNAAVIATTDLTHYGEVYGMLDAGLGEEARRWMIDRDRRIIDLATRMDAEGLIREARENRNACGAGALSAAVAFAREQGVARGTLVEHTNSYDVEGRSEPFRMAVGYAGIVF